MPIYVPKSDNRMQFIYVKDLAKAVSASVRGEVPGGIYNVADPETYTFSQFIHRCATQVGKTPKIRHVDPETLPVPLMHFFPLFDIDIFLSVDKFTPTYAQSPEWIWRCCGLMRII